MASCWPPLAILPMATAVRSTGASSFSPASPAARAGRSSWSTDAPGAPRAAAQGGKPFSHQQNNSTLLTSPPGASCAAAPGSGSLLLTSRSREHNTDGWNFLGIFQGLRKGRSFPCLVPPRSYPCVGFAGIREGVPLPSLPSCTGRGGVPEGDRSRALFPKGMESGSLYPSKLQIQQE